MLHPKVAVPALLLLVLTAAGAGLAALSDDVPWAAPVAGVIALVVQLLSGYSTRGGATGLAVDIQGADRAEVQAALKNAA